MTGIWEVHDQGGWVVVPTNRERRGDGTAVMGAGVALDAARRFPSLPHRYGGHLLDGDGFVAYSDLRVLCAPTKDRWKNPATVAMVKNAVVRLVGWARVHPEVAAVAVPALGCGRGGLDWATVLPLLGRLPVPPFMLFDDQARRVLPR